MTAFYNEIDPYAAQWLRNLIAAGHIAPGVVDERSIEDIQPEELVRYAQCHFFAGVGVWSYALRLAGWPDDRPIWTGSCPCQPFSTAGQGAGFADERHLWPAFYHLICECRPGVVVGEQVASKDADAWLDLVQTDMEALGHAFGAVAFPSAGVGAPHIRDRTYWVADANRGQQHGLAVVRGLERDGQDAGWAQSSGQLKPRGDAVGLGNDDDEGLEGLGRGHQAEGGWDGALRPAAAASELGRVADLQGERWDGRQDTTGAGRRLGVETVGIAGGMADAASGTYRREGGVLARANVGGLAESDGSGIAEHGPAGPTNGLWRDADWLFCRDGKWRPVEPGTFPLAHGAISRVGRLRAYGNAINAEAAKAFIESLM